MRCKRLQLLAWATVHLNGCSQKLLCAKAFARASCFMSGSNRRFRSSECQNRCSFRTIAFLDNGIFQANRRMRICPLKVFLQGLQGTLVCTGSAQEGRRKRQSPGRVLGVAKINGGCAVMHSDSNANAPMGGARSDCWNTSDEGRGRLRGYAPGGSNRAGR